MKVRICSASPRRIKAISVIQFQKKKIGKEENLFTDIKDDSISKNN